jgi:CRP-like cAMP-binding protein
MRSYVPRYDETAMTIDDELNILHEVPFFSHIGPTELKLLAFASDRIIFRLGQDLFHEGEEANSAYVILTGSADILQTKDAAAVKVGEALPQSIVGEVALLRDHPRDATVTATSTVEALLVTRDTFQKLIENCPETMSHILTSLGEKMSKTS